jgi:O-antigen/teichoic acid export membrane protein
MNKLQILKTKIKEKNFSTTSKTAIKNSSWQLATNLTAKLGSLIFTIVLARLLAPELYGLYGLALSTILFLAIFSDLGISQALITYLSKTIDKKPKKAKSYFYYLTKLKVYLLLLTSFLLIILARHLSNFYNKPIYLALVAGAIYLPLVQITSHLNTIFTSKNNFKIQFAKEILLQILRITIVPLSILFFLQQITKQDIYLFYLFLIISLCYLIAFIFMMILTKLNHPFKKNKSIKLTQKEKKELKKFALPLTITALSGVFFGYIDTIMLGYFVPAIQIAYYKASFDLITSAATILGFLAISLHPILSRLKGQKLESLFSKSKKFTILISTIALIITIIISSPLIKIVYGEQYTPAIPLLKWFSLLLLTFPLINLYNTYFISQKQTKTVSNALIISTILNIIFNYLFIIIGLTYSTNAAVLGVCLATILTRFIYLGILIWKKK